MTFFWIISAIIILFGFVVFFGAPYVPSKRKELQRVFDELYKLTDADTLVDIGSGDGVVLRVASEKGVSKAVGYELNIALVWISRFLSRRHKNIEVIMGNSWQMQFPSETTVVYLFGVSRDMEKHARKLQQQTNTLGRPLALVVYGHTIPHMTPLKSFGAHHLYTFTPLHVKKT
jgi:hypothetical protein